MDKKTIWTIMGIYGTLIALAVAGVAWAVVKVWAWLQGPAPGL